MPKLSPKAWGVEGEAQHNNRTRSLQHLLGIHLNHRASLSKRHLFFPARKTPSCPAEHPEKDRRRTVLTVRPETTQLVQPLSPPDTSDALGFVRSIYFFKMQKQPSQEPVSGVEGIAPGPQVPSRHCCDSSAFKTKQIYRTQDSNFTARRTTVLHNHLPSAPWI